MPSSTRPHPAIIAVLLAALIGTWWWRHRASDAPATGAVTQTQPGSAAHRTVAAPGAPAAPARLSVAVTDEHGPVTGATVRLAPDDGEVVALVTGGDGTAHVDRLEAGAWRITASAPGHLPAALPVRQIAAGADDRVAIRLAAGGRMLSGTVTDVTGGPIAGARIDAARLTRRAEPDDAIATTLTGSDGKYRLTVADGALLVAASSPDYAPQSRRVEVGPAGAVADFALVPGGVIEGVVRDERSHEPVPGATVSARRGPAMLLAETAARRATSGADGRFRIGGLRPGAWDLGARDHARTTRHPTVVGIGVAEQISDVELLVGVAPVVRGRVVDDSGAATPGVEVRALARGESEDTHADATGAFSFEALRPGTYVLTARGGGYLPSGGVRVALADKDVDGVVVTVQRGVTVTGRVEPRQTCDVQQEPDEREVLLVMNAGASTGSDGAFTLGPIAPGPARLTARCPGGDQGGAQIKVSAGMPEVILPVTGGASIAGHVVDGQGKPVAGVGIVASEVSHGERTTIRNGAVTSGAQTQSDATGAYLLTGLSAGTYHVGALDRGRPLHLRGAPPSLELAAAEHKTGVDLAIDRPVGVISGTVTGPDGKPLADAWVSAQLDLMAMLAGDGPGRPQSRTVAVENTDTGDGAAFPPALSDAQGHYEITGLPPATYTVTAEAQRGVLRARAGDIKPDATIDLHLAAVTSLSGTVTGSAGAPALISVELDGPTRAQRSFTDGKFSFDRVDPGSYTVRVQSSEGNGEARVDVTAGAPASVAITLASNAIVIGKLVDPAGKPLAGQPVVLTPDHGDGRLQVSIDGPPPTSGPDGSFRLEHRAETCALLVMRPPQPFSKRGLVLTAGQTLDLGTITVDAQPPHGGSGSPPRP